jgi:hypothetical protein
VFLWTIEFLISTTPYLQTHHLGVSLGGRGGKRPIGSPPHIADLAFHLAEARPGVVKATITVTPANVLIILSALARRGPGRHVAVEVATYAFPPVDGLRPGVENHSTARATDVWCIDAAAGDKRLMWPGHEGLIRDRSPDAVVSDIHF